MFSNIHSFILSSQDVKKLKLSLKLNISLKNPFSAAAQILVCKRRFITIHH